MFVPIFLIFQARLTAHVIVLLIVHDLWKQNSFQQHLSGGRLSRLCIRLELLTRSQVTNALLLHLLLSFQVISGDYKTPTELLLGI